MFDECLTLFTCTPTRIAMILFLVSKRETQPVRRVRLDNFVRTEMMIIPDGDSDGRPSANKNVRSPRKMQFRFAPTTLIVVFTVRPLRAPRNSCTVMRETVNVSRSPLPYTSKGMLRAHVIITYNLVVVRGHQWSKRHLTRFNHTYRYCARVVQTPRGVEFFPRAYVLTLRSTDFGKTVFAFYRNRDWTTDVVYRIGLAKCSVPLLRNDSESLSTCTLYVYKYLRVCVRALSDSVVAA